MIEKFGMGQSVVGTSREEVEILDLLYKEVHTELITYEKAINTIESVLLEKEAITQEDVEKIVG